MLDWEDGLFAESLPDEPHAARDTVIRVATAAAASRVLPEEVNTMDLLAGWVEGVLKNSGRARA
jgi:hypothetical protein